MSQTKKPDFIKIPNRITVRTKDAQVKFALGELSNYFQIKSFSELVRRCILDEFKSIKVKEEKMKELNSIAELYDLKVVPKFIRS